VGEARPRGALRRALRFVADVRREEWPVALGFAAFFFLVIATYWILKPLRTSQFLGVLGAKRLPWARLVTALLVLPVGAAIGYLSARLPHRRLLLGAAAFFGAGNLAFWALDPLVAEAWIHVPFYFWVDVYVTTCVALFWSFLNEHSTPDDAKRLYGIIGAGGMVGGIAGAALSWSLPTTIGGRNLLLLTAATTVATFPVVFFLTRRLAGRASAANGPARPSARAAWDGAPMVLGSPYLAGILGIVVLYEISSVLADYQLSSHVGAAFPGAELADQRTAYLGEFFFVTGLAGLGVQLLATSAVQRKLGLGAALSVLPLALLGGAGCFLVLPGLIGASLWSGADATLNYGIHQSSKEALYAPTSVAVKYRAKAFIDVFGNRFAKALGAALIWAFTTAGLAPRWQAAAGILLALAWLLVIRATAAR
jgi:AAA family ATP:ADP antiporter